MWAPKPSISLDMPDSVFLDTAFRLVIPFQQKLNTRYRKPGRQGIEEQKRLWLTGRDESNADHMFECGELADYFLLIEDPDGKLDHARVHRLLRVHEYDEVHFGDEPTFDKRKQTKEAALSRSLLVVESLPEPVRTQKRNDLLDYHQRRIPEAFFAKGIDAIGPPFHLLSKINWHLQKRNRVTYDKYLEKREHVEQYPYMLRFFEVIGRYHRENGIFWDAEKDEPKRVCEQVSEAN